jgi:hypothetical protein
MLDHAAFLLLFLQQGTDQTTCNATLQVSAALPSFSPPFSNKRAQQDMETRNVVPFCFGKTEEEGCWLRFQIERNKREDAPTTC